MTTSYEDDAIENEQAEEKPEAIEEPKKEGVKVDKEKVETAIQARLNQANRKHAAKEAELRAQIEELKKSSAPVAQPQSASGSVPQYTEEQIAQAHTALKQEAVAEYEHNKKVKDFQDTIKTAIEEDKEFASLLKQPKTGGLPDDIIAKTMHLKNAPAVLKHLFSNEKDYMEMVYASSPLEQQKLIHSISDKLESNSSKPGPSNFTAQPDLSGMGASTQDDDLDDYINDKYYQGIK